jgi:uncharacterized protein with GYD domain
VKAYPTCRAERDRHAAEEGLENTQQLKREGGSLLQAYWTFGRYDVVVILEAPNEKTALKALMRGGDHLSIENIAGYSSS